MAKWICNKVNQGLKSQIFLPSTITAATNWAYGSRPVLSAVIRHLDVQQDDNVFEVGFGVGLGLQMLLKKVLDGNGSVCGSERSAYLLNFVEKGFLAMNKKRFERDKHLMSGKLTLHEALDDSLPFTDNIFDTIYHVDVFYGWSQSEMDTICRELLRVLRPLRSLVCGMELGRLRRLNNYGILEEQEFDPMRYMESLQRVGFENIEIVYEKIDRNGNPSDKRDSVEIQLIFARKPIRPLLEEVKPGWAQFEKQLQKELEQKPEAVPQIPGKTLRQLEKELFERLEEEEVEAEKEAIWRRGEPKFFGIDNKKLPLDGRRNVLITSALPYVNNVPHLGNIIGSMLSADVFSRYCRMREYQSLFICGTDEYGTATEMKAFSEGISPRELCDKFYALHKKAYDWFSIDFDFFGRTTNQHQTEIAQEIFKKVHDNGYTSIGTQMQLHCGNCQKFLADRFVNGICPHCDFGDARGDQCDGCGRLLNAVELVEPKCVICGNKPTPEESRHIFLDLDTLSPQLQDFLDRSLDSPNSHWSGSAVAITKSWLKKGLEKRCITRDLKWGTPVPLEEFGSKVFYVWFDAPIGYMSITKSLLGEDWSRWWKNPDDVELFNFLGKDNVAFHSIIFPATLLATKEPFTQPRHICATEHLLYGDQKFSKSRGVGVFGDFVASIGIPADVIRFYLLYMRPEGADTAFCWDDFAAKVNSELLANLGNFVLRTLTFLSNNYGGFQPRIEPTSVEDELFTAVDQEMREYVRAMEDVRMRDALQHILAISRKGNQYMQAGQPWALVKGTPEERKRAETTIGVSANLNVLLSVLLYPFMPSISEQIQEQCNLSKNIVMPEHFILFLKAGHKHNKPFALFTKFEPAKVAEWKALFGGTQQQQQPQSQAVANGVKTTKSPTKANKREEKGRDKKALNMAQNGGAEDGPRRHSTAGVGQMYAEVVDKFEKAKKIFVANECAKLDMEIADLNGQIEQQKTRLGYCGPLFPSPTPKTITTTSPTAETKSEGKSAAIPPPSTSAVKEEAQKLQQPKKQKAGGGKKESFSVPTATDDSIDVGRLDLRVGRIIEAQKHPDADALYVEQIDLGEGKPRTVVSGLVRFIPLEQLNNRLVVCLCNLKPAKMRGVESQAMVMCASTPEKVEPLEVDPNSEPGDIVVCAPFVRRPDQQLNPKKKIWETVAPDLSVSDSGECVYKGHTLRVERLNSSLSASTLRNVPVK